jgi:uncharacterized lipoprotein YehR (DUF1307 family)
MKRISAVLGALLVFAMLLSLAGCGKKEENSLVGTWEYSDTESGIGAVYVLKDDGTGTYTMKVGETEVTYELKYEVKDGHLLVRYVNNEIFTEDDVFDNEFSFRDAKTLIVKDTLGEELPFIRK